ncbi:hypothetical protein MNV49_006056 [Pseudohyphozyma bogoriensis]|nr:hypothetical protein MNV49_006056 [Pseudohyphozyma bogoriensis]
MAHLLAPFEEERGWAGRDGSPELFAPLEDDSYGHTAEKESSVPEAEAAPLSSPPATPKKGVGKKRGRGASAPNPSPKKLKVVSRPKTSSQLLEDVLALQDYLFLRATFKSVDDETAILRIYLVHSDLEDLRLEEVAKSRRGNPSKLMTRTVLDAIRNNKEEWEGMVAPEDTPLLLVDHDRRSLLEVYRSVDSPPDENEFEAFLENLVACDAVKTRLQNAILDSPQGMKTELYPYQKMLPDPSYLNFTGIHGDAFFVSIEGKVKKTLDLWDCFKEPKGGFLSEDMGSGKTAISIGLILSTLGELPNLAGVNTHLDKTPSPSPVLMTDLSHDFPFTQYRDELRKMRPRVPKPLLGYEMTTVEQEEYDEQLARQELEDRMEVAPPLPSLRSITINLLKTTVGHDFSSGKYEALEGTRFRQELLDTLPFYYLHPSEAQLDSREGRRGDYMPVKITVSPATLAVAPTELIQQWKGEFEKHVEESAGVRILVLRTTKDQFPSIEDLARYDIVVLSVARFGDAADDLRSPLRSIHWKRLLVDEGHVMAGENRMRKLADELRCECNWVISGTPTKNLRGGDDSAALFAIEVKTGGDEGDSDRLGSIFTRFLKHPAFNRRDYWRHTFTVPTFQEGRGMSRLFAILNRALVRNVHSRIAQAYTLPPIHSEVVYLNMGNAERKTYNALLALFSSNSILSQRKDQDWHFHSSNRKHLDELVLNLSASSFFFASPTLLKDLTAAVEHSREALETEKSSKWTDADKVALKEAIDQINSALWDREWNHIIGSVTVNLEAEGLDTEISRTFAGLLPPGQDPTPTLFPLGSLVTLRRNLKALRSIEKPEWSDDEELTEELITFEMNRQRAMNEKPDKQAAAGPADDAVRPKPKKPFTGPLVPLPTDSIFSKVVLGQSTSAKLNYVVNEVRRYPEEKFIIFSSTLPDLLFANLSEAFDMLRIRHSIFAGRGRGKDRGSIAAEFNKVSVQERQVILVDARLGGRGLHLTAASRVIFLEPIWIPDLEAQAAKRAHRLGQTRPVHLQVLVIKGSYEDELLKRRSQLDPTAFNQAKKPQSDSKLRDLLQGAEYLPERKDKSTKPLAKISLLSPDEGGVEVQPVVPAVEELRAVKREASEPLVPVKQEDDGEPPKKKKKVMFAM